MVPKNQDIMLAGITDVMMLIVVKAIRIWMKKVAPNLIPKSLCMDIGMAIIIVQAKGVDQVVEEVLAAVEVIIHIRAALLGKIVCNFDQTRRTSEAAGAAALLGYSGPNTVVRTLCT